jgi:hypothetical protein
MRYLQNQVHEVPNISRLSSLGSNWQKYRCGGWITANWNTIQDQTQSFAYNASAQVLHMINDTASKFVFANTHPSLAGEATPISAAIGFTTGFALGVY